VHKLVNDCRHEADWLAPIMDVCVSNTFTKKNQFIYASSVGFFTWWLSKSV